MKEAVALIPARGSSKGIKNKNIVPLASCPLLTYAVEVARDAPFQPRQSLPKAFQPNGAIYVFSVRDFPIADVIPRRGLRPFFMDRKSNLDIDCMEDLAEAEFVLSGHRA